MTLLLKRLLLLPLSLILLVISFFFSAIVYRKKIYSAHFTYKFFGHAAIEPAIASSFITHNNIKFFSSHQRFSGSDNYFLYTISRSLFSNLVIPLYLNQYIYNASLPFFKQLISNYYSPLFPKRVDRELYYLSYLSTDLHFPWRSLVQDKLDYFEVFRQDTSHLPILLACRTSHFHSNSSDVATQNYRNLDLLELIHFLRSVLQSDQTTSFIIYSSDDTISQLKVSLNIYKNRIEYVDQQTCDVIPLFMRSRLLVNNGNGIGAFAYSFGFPTLYIKHSPYQSWHSSHLNAVSIPPIYSTSTSFSSLDLSKSLELSFSTSSSLPFDFDGIYRSRGISYFL